jgi:hypothetical protein
VIAFSRGAQAFLDESGRMIDEGSDEAEMLRGYCRRIVVLGVLFPVFFALIVPIATPWAAYFVQHPRTPVGACVATCIGLIFSLGTALFYVFAGVAASCLFSPDEFLGSPVGHKWLELIGTKNFRAARFVCFITVAAAMLIAAGLALVQIILMNGKGFK